MNDVEVTAVGLVLFLDAIFADGFALDLWGPRTIIAVDLNNPIGMLCLNLQIPLDL